MDNSSNSAQIDALNDLLTRHYDAEKGYKEAADDAESTSLKQTFQRLAQQRYDFGHQIKGELSKLGGEPDKGDSLASKVHRAWIELRTALSGNDDAAVIDECIRGEETALNTYQEVLNNNTFSAETRMVITNQHSKIQQTLNDLRQMRNTFDVAS